LCLRGWYMFNPVLAAGYLWRRLDRDGGRGNFTCFESCNRETFLKFAPDSTAE
jgi:hypothetical protein